MVALCDEKCLHIAMAICYIFYAQFIGKMHFIYEKMAFLKSCLHMVAMTPREDNERGIHFGMHCVGKLCLDIIMAMFYKYDISTGMSYLLYYTEQPSIW